jgi:hypothetical protein
VNPWLLGYLVFGVLLMRRRQTGKPLGPGMCGRAEADRARDLEILLNIDAMVILLDDGTPAMVHPFATTRHVQRGGCRWCHGGKRLHPATGARLCRPERRP